MAEDAFIEAVAENVSATTRSTTLTENGASVMTVEHLLSALTGMGIDNALIDIDNCEVPILDGSAKPYIDAIWKDGIVAQKAERKYIEIEKELVITSEKTGSSVIGGRSGEGELYDRLRQLRVKIAEKRHVPVYCILSNDALAGLAESRPETPDEALEVRGIGIAKLTTIVPQFLREIARWKAENRDP